MAKIGVGSILGSYAQSAGWKALNQLINSNSRFGIFDANGNAFYENGLNRADIELFNKKFTFYSGNALAESGVTALNYNKNYNITTAPIEQGHQIPYNLVEQPRQGQVTYVSTGTEKQRAYFEKALEKAQKEIIFYNLHTAERVMPNIKITGYSVNRSSSQGTQLIQYQITFQEVMVSVNMAGLGDPVPFFSDSKDQGQLATNAPSGSQQQAASKTQ
ncbi:unnamed protein product [Commensalibacter communis]|uniref:Dit-like phage tail protein N-terminal domain-containing protein n=1 Tax=Commensalibacter communis TaxID=2972786 RepID=A0A9W4X7Q1_9PROT|nr:hypothetical protein [Commensalibacter communis]CAI3955095.1 unnamed protein product [Commensalibacter communis]CAI3955853.1 unnamed protein product [Commensalibacter communis]CAI3956654.1 unnamed protein product [Commensalibacter communis]CAI3958093.1 unnamed protein product [Commensalibacter communis]CAI3958816.1 unnamed protein product [Commensalibacter communis]